MYKFAGDLEPGDVVRVKGKTVVIEMVNDDGSTVHIRHSDGGGWVGPRSKWLVISAGDAVSEAEDIIRGGS